MIMAEVSVDGWKQFLSMVSPAFFDDRRGEQS